MMTGAADRDEVEKFRWHDIEQKMNMEETMRQSGKIDYLELPAAGGTLDLVKTF